MGPKDFLVLFVQFSLKMFAKTAETSLDNMMTKRVWKKKILFNFSQQSFSH